MAEDARANGRRLDPVAVDAALRRIARGGGPPWLHQEIARRLGERLAPMRAQPERIFDWWAAVGAGREVLQQRYPRAEIVAVEAKSQPSMSWRGTTKRLWWRRAPATPPHLDNEGVATLGRGQLVWANMMLHGVPDPPALFARWGELLVVEGVAAFSCLGPATLAELRELYADEGWPAPTPGFVDMHDLGDMLAEAGFSDPVLDQETLHLTWPNADAFLDELHGLGGNAAPDRFAGLRTPKWRQRLVAALARRADGEGRIAMSFEVAYGHGFKSPPRARAGAPVAVSLDDMRAMVRRRASST